AALDLLELRRLPRPAGEPRPPADRRSPPGEDRGSSGATVAVRVDGRGWAQPEPGGRWRRARVPRGQSRPPPLPSSRAARGLPRAPRRRVPGKPPARSPRWEGAREEAPP